MTPAAPAVADAGTAEIWAVLPAAGRGTRFGGDTPKQYLQAGGLSLLGHALDALLAHPRVAGAVVALAADDDRWPGWTMRLGKPVLRCEGGDERADSVLAARALFHGRFAGLEVLDLGGQRGVALLQSRVLTGLLLHLRLQRGDRTVATLPRPQPELQQC